MNAPVTPPVVTIDQRVDQFVKIRDQVRKLKEEHTEVLRPYNEVLEQLEGVLLAHLLQTGSESIRTKNGTVYRTDKKSAPVVDMEAFWSFIVATGRFELIDKKANLSAVEDFIDQSIEDAKLDPTKTPGPPPGVNFSRRHTIGVRRA